MEGDGARQALNLDHERRLMDLEREFGPRGRVTIMEATLASLSPKVDEMLLADRVTEGVTAALKRERRDHDTHGMNLWTKAGIAAAISFGAVSSVVVVLQALWPS